MLVIVMHIIHIVIVVLLGILQPCLAQNGGLLHFDEIAVSVDIIVLECHAMKEIRQ